MHTHLSSTKLPTLTLCRNIWKFELCKRKRERIKYGYGDVNPF